MPLWLSGVLWAVPTAFMFASIYLFMPWLVSLGISGFQAMMTAHIVPMALLFTAALVAFHRVEGHPLTWKAFAERFRYPRPRLKDVLWALAIFAACMVGYGIFSQVSATLVARGILPIPQGLPGLMDPRVKQTAAMLDQMAGGSMRGNWGAAALYFVMLFFNIAGEELWWRGYLLPRQELAHGRGAWVVQGTLWALFHLFKWWDVIGLLPVCLIITFSAQRMRNNGPVFIAHYIFNGLGLALILAAVLGSAVVLRQRLPGVWSSPGGWALGRMPPEREPPAGCHSTAHAAQRPAGGRRVRAGPLSVRSAPGCWLAVPLDGSEPHARGGAKTVNTARSQ